MPLKEIAVLIVFLVFILPGIISLIAISIKTANDPSPKNIGENIEEVAKKTIPWWVGVFEWLASLPSKIAGFLIVGFIFLLMWIGVFK